MKNRKGKLLRLVLWMAVVICSIYILRLTAPVIYENTLGSFINSMQYELCSCIEKLFGAAVPEISYMFRKNK